MSRTYIISSNNLSNKDVQCVHAAILCEFYTLCLILCLILISFFTPSLDMGLKIK